ncbi:MAG: NurA protein [Thermoproteota archaeon]|nr:NurA protein [Thermoproteota archaeon]
MEVTTLSQQTPRDFARLGRGSLEGIIASSFKPKTSDLFDQDFRSLNDKLILNTNNEDGVIDPITLHSLNDETPVFGVDTSNIELGETKDGTLCAVRGTIVWRENGSYQYVRHGPFIFHISEANKQALYNTLRQIHFNEDEAVGAPIVEKMSDRIRGILERWLQRQICESCEDSLLLFDGSLTTRTVNGPISVLGELLSAARSRNNAVLAISKETSLSVAGHRMADLIDNKYAPCLLDIDRIALSQYGSHLHFFGRIYAAKLISSCFTFRLDVDRKIPKEEGIRAVERLLGNDLIAENYPETLRLAHVLSRFSASEVLAMQRFVAENYNLKVICRPNIRQVLFGPYGGFSAMRQEGADGYDADLQD